MLSEGCIPAMLAGAADEVYGQTYFNYDLIGYLCVGDEERDYRVRLDVGKRKMIGEGAGMLVMETLEHARERNAAVLGEVLGYGMSMDAGPFESQNMTTEGLEWTIESACSRAGIGPGDIELVAWAPQGNAQDGKVLGALERVMSDANPPAMAATSLNTGYIESASILVSLASVLEAIRSGTKLWPQLTGLGELDSRTLSGPPKYVLACGSSDVGYNFAMVVKPGPVA